MNTPKPQNLKPTICFDKPCLLSASDKKDEILCLTNIITTLGRQVYIYLETLYERTKQLDIIKLIYQIEIRHQKNAASQENYFCWMEPLQIFHNLSY